MWGPCGAAGRVCFACASGAHQRTTEHSRCPLRVRQVNNVTLDVFLNFGDEREKHLVRPGPTQGAPTRSTQLPLQPRCQHRCARGADAAPASARRCARRSPTGSSARQSTSWSQTAGCAAQRAPARAPPLPAAARASARARSDDVTPAAGGARSPLPARSRTPSRSARSSSSSAPCGSSTSTPPSWRAALHPFHIHFPSSFPLFVLRCCCSALRRTMATPRPRVLNTHPCILAFPCGTAVEALRARPRLHDGRPPGEGGVAGPEPKGRRPHRQGARRAGPAAVPAARRARAFARESKDSGDVQRRRGRKHRRRRGGSSRART